MADLSDAQRVLILDALRRGQKIEAIKLYREGTGAGLKEAKDSIDVLLVALKEETETFAETSQRGCGTGVFLMLLLATTVGFAVS